MPRSKKDSREATVWLAVFTGLVFLYPFAFGWSGWMRLAALPAAFASTGVLIFVTGFVQGFLGDTWPAVPPDLAERVVQFQADGWSTDRVHRWWACDEACPHVHMTRQDDGGTLVIIWNGTTYLDAAGNVLRHEP